MAKKTKEELQWEAEGDLRALRQVEEIKADKARLARAKKLARKEMAALKKVGGAKKRTAKK